MRKWRYLTLAGIMALSAVAMAQPPRVPGPGVSIICPELPPDCCRFQVVNGCRMCTQPGCG